MKRIFIALISLCLLILAGCSGKEMVKSVTEEKYCKTVDDCACGVHIKEGNCFYGNRRFVDVSHQCPDFCTGISANLHIFCENNTCIQRYVK